MAGKHNSDVLTTLPMTDHDDTITIICFFEETEMMKSANGIPYSYLLDLFRKGEPMIDETTFYFMEESPGDNHIIGYLGYGSEPVTDKPYWAGYCDYENGFVTNTADELFEAPIYGGRSLKDRWKDVYIWTIGPMEPNEFIRMFRDKYRPFS